MKYLLLHSLVFLLSLSAVTCSGCGKNPSNPGENQHPVKTNDFLVDTLATPETVALYRHLKSLAGNSVLFGHQDDLAYGVGWWAEEGRSDVRDVCGDYPAVTGWDLGDIHKTTNLDGVSFSRMKQWIKDVYARGGINTISMHLDNPVTLENAWDNSPAVSAILPGGSHHASYLKTLEKTAVFLKDLKTGDGTFIPVIFRPYHEHNHGWAWWGSQSCTIEEYNALWIMTVEYLRDDQHLHHLLYAISPQEVRTESAYLERYPGDAYVDIFGTDYYRLYERSHVTELGASLAMISRLAESRGKISALTEIGLEKIPIPDWWTRYLLAAIRRDADSQKIAWTLVWRNASETHYFAPYPGQLSVPNFIQFYQDPFTLFGQDLPDMYQIDAE